MQDPVVIQDQGFAWLQTIDDLQIGIRRVPVEPVKGFPFDIRQRRPRLFDCFFDIGTVIDATQPARSVDQGRYRLAERTGSLFCLVRQIKGESLFQHRQQFGTFAAEAVANGFSADKPVLATRPCRIHAEQGQHRWRVCMRCQFSR